MNYNIDDFFTSRTGDMIFGGLAIFLIIFVIFIIMICLVAIVLKIIGTWKILEKAGKPGWAALIPFYNTFMLCEITGVRPIWIIATLIISIVSSTISGFVNAFTFALPFVSYVTFLIGMLSFAITVYFSIILNISLAKSFGKEDSYAIGLILLEPVFYFMLGTDSSKYLGPNPMKDTVYEFVNSKIDLSCFGSLTKSTANKETKAEFIKKCPLCGNKNTEKSKYCAVCGNKL